MDAGAAVRAARRRCGLSQLEFASRAGVSARTLAAVESGASDPRWSTVARLLASAQLETTVVPRSPEPSGPLLRYLRLPTSTRLALTVTGSWRPRPTSPVWEALEALARRGEVRLDGPTAVGLWLPVTMTADLRPLGRRLPRGPLRVAFHGRADRAGAPPGHLTVTVHGAAAPVGDVRVSMGGRLHVRVPAPLVLAHHPACGAHAEQLRVAAALLEARGGRDLSGRRGAAHRDPDETREYGELLPRRSQAHSELPDAQDSRAWRLTRSSSLAGWLLDHPLRR